MTQTKDQRREAGRELARGIFHKTNKSADQNLDDLLEAIGAIDDMMDALPATLNQTKTVRQNFFEVLPQPFKGNTNAKEKTMAIGAWAQRETGLV